MKSKKGEIIRRAGAGDLEAFRQIHEEYGRRILNFIFRLIESREDAEDLAQNVFLIAFQELRRLQDVERFEPWLYRIARNEVYQAFRRKRGEPQIFEPSAAQDGSALLELEPPDNSPNPQDRMLQKELGTRMSLAMRSLPPKLREVFVLAVIHEKSYTEIAEIVGRSLLAVKTDIFRARTMARASLGRYLESKK